MRKERVLITGGASGIGAAIAERCRADGLDVVIIDRIGDGIIADLSSPTETAAALVKALEGGPITRLVNNVGMVRPAPISTSWGSGERVGLGDTTPQSLEDLEAVWALNVRCTQQCTQALLPGMKEARFGRIVNMASRAALGKEWRTAYAASKAALLGMTRVWALELGEYGITANAIGPGPIRTELFDKANPPGAPRTQRIIDSVPVKRVGTPEDIAHAAAYFLDERSGFTTGQVLYVCGGMTVGVAPV